MFSKGFLLILQLHSDVRVLNHVANINKIFLKCKKMTEKNGKIDFRNPARLEAEKRRKQIAALYLEYKSKAVEGSPEYRIMEAVAHRMGCTQQNVRVQLIKAGVYTPKQRV